MHAHERRPRRTSQRSGGGALPISSPVGYAAAIGFLNSSCSTVWRHAGQKSVRPFKIVDVLPFVGHVLRFGQGVDDFLIDIMVRDIERIR